MQQVRNSEVNHAIAAISKSLHIAIDTETTGLRPYHGDRIFSVIVSCDNGAFYFPVLVTTPLQDSGGEVLSPESIYLLRECIARYDNTIYMHNAKFDMRFLTCEGYEFNPHAKIHDTMVGARLLNSELEHYSLDFCGFYFLGERKDDKVKQYIEENHLWDWVDVEGIATRPKAMYFHKVPQELIVPYALQDTVLTYKLGLYQDTKIKMLDSKLCSIKPDSYKTLRSVMNHEIKLTRTVFDMEHRGVRIDVDLCRRRIKDETRTIDDAKSQFLKLTGRDYKASSKLFEEIFKDVGIDTARLPRTSTGATSFAAAAIKDVPEEFTKHIAAIKRAKTNINFYSGFLWYTDNKEILRTDFKQSGTRTWRFASGNPNLQNVKKSEETTEEEIVGVRQAIIPHSSEYCLVMIDYDQMEYRVMLDYAGEMALIERIKAGADIHQATADMIGITRTKAKTLNFALLYGAGRTKISEMLGIPPNEAHLLIRSYFEKLERVQSFINRVKHAPVQKKAYGCGSQFLWTWFGRQLHFDKWEDTYKAPNHLIQGGCADIVRVAMNRCADLLKDKRSFLSLTIHDELVFNIHITELDLVAPLHAIMEKAYPYRYLPLTASVSHSWKSLGDKVKGYPTLQSRDQEACLVGSQDLKHRQATASPALDQMV